MEGPGFTKVLRNISWLAGVYRNQDHVEKAIELQAFVVEESVRVLGPDARDTLDWKEQLARFQREACVYSGDERNLSNIATAIEASRTQRRQAMVSKFRKYIPKQIRDKFSSGVKW